MMSCKENVMKALCSVEPSKFLPPITIKVSLHSKEVAKDQEEEIQAELWWTNGKYNAKWTNGVGSVMLWWATPILVRGLTHIGGGTMAGCLIWHCRVSVVRQEIFQFWQNSCKSFFLSGTHTASPYSNFGFNIVLHIFIQEVRGHSGIP